MYWNRKMRSLRQMTRKHTIELLRWGGRMDRKEKEWLAQRLVDAVGSPKGAQCVRCQGWFMNTPHRKDGRCAGCWLKAAEDACIKEDGDGGA